VRVLALASLVALAAGASRGTARADDDGGDEDGEFKPFPALSIAVAVTVHSTRIGGQRETGVGPTLELALGRARWQYFVEGSFATARTSTDAMVGGSMASGGLGLRWLARQFRPGSNAGIELFLLSRAGFQRFYLADNMRLDRPELAFGFGIQGRVFKRPRLAFRLDARVLFTPNDDEDVLASCRGRCTNEVGSAFGIGFGW
jgi:hypothetical protein